MSNSSIFVLLSSINFLQLLTSNTSNTCERLFLEKILVTIEYLQDKGLFVVSTQQSGQSQNNSFNNLNTGCSVLCIQHLNRITNCKLKLQQRNRTEVPEGADDMNNLGLSSNIL